MASNSPPPPSPPPTFSTPPPTRPIILIIGPTGCGKTTIATSVSLSFNLPYIKGDDFHTPENIAKMSNGIPLTDNERWAWLEALRDKAADQPDGCIISCSCLKRKYRDVFRVGGDAIVRFIYLCIDETLVLERVKARKGHYMKDEMVHSEFVELEEPEEDESDVFFVEADGEKGEVAKRALGVVGCALLDMW